MLEKLLTKLFGNKLYIVTIHRLRYFHKFEQIFLFHKDEKLEKIKNSFKKYDYIESIELKRDKKLKSPDLGKFSCNNEKCIKSYDD